MHHHVVGSDDVNPNIQRQRHPDFVGLNRGVQSGGKVLLQNVFRGAAILGRARHVRSGRQHLQMLLRQLADQAQP